MIGPHMQATLAKYKADEAFADLVRKHGLPLDPERRAAQECAAFEAA